MNISRSAVTTQIQILLLNENKFQLMLCVYRWHWFLYSCCFYAAFTWDRNFCYYSSLDVDLQNACFQIVSIDATALVVAAVAVILCTLNGDLDDSPLSVIQQK